ncbi:hypothetical protein E2P81_ATG04370 [Venturia nashicola]|uniref:Uncharacterized protein n=1 Tax=Venturia nashicola TaxID=86259 RepID=A0A4Z1PAQ9_9PEZI|nr:hypothetical protein E6O75_ATG04473 [Venturia nashicola]TLD37558.1 hypothetical protein E2P81_ATG04370 [Venturia nashicola]
MEQTANVHQLLQQAENNVNLLVQLGIKSLSELSESPKSSKEWVRSGFTFSSLGYLLPVDCRERLGKFNSKPPTNPTARLPPAPYPRISRTSLECKSRQHSGRTEPTVSVSHDWNRPYESSSISTVN